MAEEKDWLDSVVERSINKNIDRLAKGREHLMTPRSRELLAAVVHNSVVDVLNELCEEKDDG